MIRASFSQIVSSMRYRRMAYLSLALEVALGSTVVAYMLALGDGLRSIALDSIGFDESRTFSVAIEQPPRGSPDRRKERELAELRALPGVATAAWVELPPLSRRELQEQVITPRGPRLIWSLSGDENLLDVLGLQVTLGRGFQASDVTGAGPRPAVLTRALAEQFGTGVQPLGKRLRSDALGELVIVGVIDAPLRVGPFYAKICEMVLVPARPPESRRTMYLVRTTNAAAGSWKQVAAAALAQGPARWVAVERLDETREYAVRNVAGADTIILITVLGMVMVVLVGSLGMASSLIVERSRQIGVRRALGARKADIAAYFMLENLFATALGIALSALFCAGLDQLLQPIKGQLVIDWPVYLKVGAAMFLVSGQLAVFWPARRAALIAPSIASRPA